MIETDGLPARLARNLSGLERRVASADGLRAASVAVCVVVHDGTPSLLMTRRAPRLRAHAGQFALPGGRRDGAETAEQAALRELSEETGLRASSDAVLGVLDDYVTRSGYVMTPVVCWGSDITGELAGPPGEVQTVYVVPLAEVDVEPEFITIPESDAPVIRLPFLDQFLHAPAAAIIYQFCRVALHGEPIRVVHFEQPVFAWK